MDESVYRIRRFESTDYEPQARIVAELDPSLKFSADEIRHWDQVTSRPPFVLTKFTAVERSSGAVAGLAALQSDAESFDPNTFWLNVWVTGPHQGRGVGRALADHLEREIQRLGGRRLWASGRPEDARGMRFLARQGFVEVRRTWLSRLDLSRETGIPDRSEELQRQGITFSTLAEEGPENPGTLRAVYDLSAVTSADVPRVGTFTPPPYEQFVDLELRGPAVLQDAYFLAKDGARYIGSSAVMRLEAQPDAVLQSFTGVIREYRGRGIASELKRRAVEYGRTHGFRTMVTGNDSLNRPILAINRKLGFSPERERIVAERSIPRT